SRWTPIDAAARFFICPTDGRLPTPAKGRPKQASTNAKNRLRTAIRQKNANIRIFMPQHLHNIMQFGKFAT
ncbi:MAG: hypothetical protein K2I51_06375, partial [Muribaculaceae bacterium]|nr:hypothetical protein [Muribaculaceae bacterium]